MKVFSCGGVLPGCPEVLTGADVDAVLAAVAEHAARAHGITEVPPSVADQVREQVRDEPG